MADAAAAARLAALAPDDRPTVSSWVDTATDPVPAAPVATDPTELVALSAHYRRQLAAAPADPLIVRNYARFLAESAGDYDAAEPLLERACALNPDDGEFLAFAARAVWEARRDGAKASALFAAALAAAPADCFVLAAYTAFLWQWEDGEPPSGDGAGSDSGRRGGAVPRAVERMERAFWGPSAEGF